MAAAEYDAHILSTLSDAERAAIEEEQTPEELAAIAAIANGDDDDDDDDDAAGDTGAAVADPAAVVPAKPVEDAAKPDDVKPAETPAVEDQADKPFTPTYQAKLPDDFEAQQTALKEQAEALAAKFKAGDIDFDQYRLEAETISKAERVLDQVQLKANLSQEMTAQSAEQQWNFTVNRFMAATAKSDGIDYKVDTEKNADLDLFVKSLARDPKNEDKSAEWFLNEAHKRVKALHGIGLAVAPVVADPKASRKPPISAAPKTLSQVPGGDGPGDVDGNEFSEIDRLKGDALESAIAKMTPAQRERYMAV